MSVVRVSRQVKAPITDVWSAIADFGGVYRFSGGVKTSTINEGTPNSGVGAERLCTLYDGNTLQERVTESVDGTSLSIEIFDSSMPISTAGARFELALAADGGTDVTVVMDYTVKYGPFGLVIDALIMRRAMRKSFTNLLAGLDHHLATGEEIGPNWKEA